MLPVIFSTLAAIIAAVISFLLWYSSTSTTLQISIWVFVTIVWGISAFIHYKNYLLLKELEK